MSLHADHHTCLHLSAADVRSAAPGADEARQAVEDAFVALHHGRAASPPKQSMALGPGRSFQCLISSWEEKGFAAAKWLGVVPVPPGSTAEGIHATILLSDGVTGRPLAVMDGNVVTGIRTAAMSAVAAARLARAASRVLGFIGCGLQARHHLAAMKAALPVLEEVVAFSRSRTSAEALLEIAAAQGWRGRVATTAEEAVRAADVLVTTVPMSAGFAPFLDPAWIPDGAFVSAVDIGRSWLPDGLRRLDLLATDNHAQQAESPAIGPGLGPIGTFDADLGELAAGAKPGRTGRAERAMFIFRGLGLADLALAAAVYRRALAAGLGRRLSP